MTWRENDEEKLENYFRLKFEFIKNNNREKFSLRQQPHAIEKQKNFVIFFMETAIMNACTQ